MARCRVDVHVSSATAFGLATESVVWFHRWNGNSPSLKGGAWNYKTFNTRRFILHKGTVRGHLVISGRPYNFGTCEYLGVGTLSQVSEPHQLRV